MEEHILEKVIAVEKESQERLDREEKHFHTLVEKAAGDAEKELTREEERLQAALVKAVTDAKEISEKRAAEQIQEARLKAEGIERISDDLLRRIVMRHIPGILPDGEEEP